MNSWEHQTPLVPFFVNTTNQDLDLYGRQLGLKEILETDDDLKDNQSPRNSGDERVALASSLCGRDT